MMFLDDLLSDINVAALLTFPHAWANIVSSELDCWIVGLGKFCPALLHTHKEELQRLAQGHFNVWKVGG